MIKTFRHRGLKRLFFDGDGSRVPAGHREKIERILFRLEIAGEPRDVDLPGYRLHPLKGDLKGFWSVTATGNRRIVFRFQGSDVCDVDLVDYH